MPEHNKENIEIRNEKKKNASLETYCAVPLCCGILFIFLFSLDLVCGSKFLSNLRWELGKERIEIGDEIFISL